MNYFFIKFTLLLAAIAPAICRDSQINGPNGSNRPSTLPKVLITNMKNGNNCNGTVISSQRILVPRQCAPSSNQPEMLMMYINDQDQQKSGGGQQQQQQPIQIKGQTIYRLRHSGSSLVELERPLNGLNNNVEQHPMLEQRQWLYPPMNQHEYGGYGGYGGYGYEQGGAYGMEQSWSCIMEQLYTVDVCELCYYVPNVCPYSTQYPYY